MVANARHNGTEWTTIIPIPELESALGAAADGLPSDITIADASTSTPVYVDDDGVQLPLGPFTVVGTL